MNRPWLYAKETLSSFHGNYTLQGLIDEMKDNHQYLIELEKIAAKKGTSVYEAFQGQQIGEFLVLAPSKKRYIELIPSLDKTPPSYAETKTILRSLLELTKTAVEAVKESWNIETLDENPPGRRQHRFDGCQNKPARFSLWAGGMSIFHLSVGSHRQARLIFPELTKFLNQQLQ
jgi:hypothetical protein